MPTSFFQRIKVFISYPGRDGLIIAEKLAAILKQAGHKVWLYESNKTWGSPTWREISVCITDRSDAFIYVCTACSLGSRGQELEAGYALDEPRVKPLVLIINGAMVPPELRGLNRENVRMTELKERLEGVVRNLPVTVKRIQRLERAVKAKATRAIS